MADGSSIAGIGHNGGPAAPFEGFEVHIADLFEEAKGFLDGEGVQSQGQADAVSALLEMLRQANKDADAARAAEKKPHDDAAKAVQAKWKPLLDRAELAMRTCKDALAPWLQKLEAEKRALAEQARREAAEKAAQAAAALAAAQTDLAAREAAEAQLADAKRADKAARKAESDKAHAKGGTGRATTLRTYYTPVLTDPKAALIHFVSTQTEEVKAFLLQLAKAEVAAGHRQIPGFRVDEERRAV